MTYCQACLKCSQAGCDILKFQITYYLKRLIKPANSNQNLLHIISMYWGYLQLPVKLPKQDHPPRLTKPNQVKVLWWNCPLNFWQNEILIRQLMGTFKTCYYKWVDLNWNIFQLYKYMIVVLKSFILEFDISISKYRPQTKTYPCNGALSQSWLKVDPLLDHRSA